MDWWASPEDAQAHFKAELFRVGALGVFFVALMGLAPVVATASFPLINLPEFYLSFTILVSLILVSLILVKYPDRVGLVNT